MAASTRSSRSPDSRCSRCSSSRFKLDIGFVSLSIGLVLALWAPNTQKRAMSQVAWPEIMLITGV